MSTRPTSAAERPPADLVGLDPAWSRLVHVPGIDGVGRTWHILDSDTAATGTAELTLLCVHGNPSWSYLWRRLIAAGLSRYPARVRTIAVDQLDMGFSERTGVRRTLAMRIDDLCALTATLELAGPVITIAHDWGGPISLGWALRHRADRDAAEHTAAVPYLAGVVLTNTAVHQPASASAPALIRLARSRPLLRPVTVNTGLFLQGALEMSRPRLHADVRAGFRAPYRHAARREAIADFVADIPLDPQHESADTLDTIAAGLVELTDTPALLLWGPRDKVFSDLYLHDLQQRLPHAEVHRFPEAAHFVGEDADVAGAICTWLERVLDPVEATDTPVTMPGIAAHPSHETRRALADFSTALPTSPAVVESTGTRRSVTFAEFADRVEHLAMGMALFGLHPGDRVAVLITPGIDLCLTVYGCWRLGVTLVLVDAGLGRAGMQRALQGADPDYLIGIDKALIAAKLLGWPGKRVAVGSRSATLTRALDIVTDLEALQGLGCEGSPLSFPDPHTLAAVAFTSGSTGPSKGVVYRHHQIQAQRDALMSLYSLSPDDRLVAAFAPFALYGPTMGITSTVPDMDVKAPGTLTATSLLDAVARIDATLVFASPAALVNVMATIDASEPAERRCCDAVRLVLSAGAPVRATLLRQASTLFGAADFHTPYGMTELLPLADISLAELTALDESDSADAGDGVCVGHPVPGIDVAIDALDAMGEPTGSLCTDAGVLGEIVARAAHARDGYDRLWLTQHRASIPQGWHRTGDIGELDVHGRLWVGGRLGHVITAPAGPIAPVATEQRIEALDEVDLAALVGVGPIGTQVMVAVLQVVADSHPPGAASLTLIDRVRAIVGPAIDVAAVLVVKALPVDRRHNSKVDRSALAHWASRTLSGERVAAP